MIDSKPTESEVPSQRVLAARLIGGFFAIGGLALYYVGRGMVLRGSPIKVEWMAIGIGGLGLAMILFPRAGWVQRAVARFDDK